jgi:hypothetical protein
VSLGAVFLLNFHFYSFFKRHRGVWFSTRAFAMLTLYYFYSGTVFALCYGAHILRRARGGATPGARATELGRIGDA